jgi:hypothetical protein
MADPRASKSCSIGNITAEHIFQNFDSILLIDAGAADGFTITDDAGGTAPIPTGVPVSIGKVSGSVTYLKVSPTGSAALNVSYVLYQ